jgi:hypothetical protein
MNKKEKIIACYGNLNQQSTMLICSTSQTYVAHVWGMQGFEYRSSKKRYKENGYKN